MRTNYQYNLPSDVIDSSRNYTRRGAFPLFVERLLSEPEGSHLQKYG